jgi:hypothetical protein
VTGMNLLSHPFRLDTTGAVATVEDDSDDAIAEGVAVLVLTRRGERDLCPDFGCTDQRFEQVDVAEINAGLADYGPAVTVGSVQTFTTDTTLTAVLTLETGDET